MLSKMEVRAVPAVLLLALSVLATGVVLAGETETRDARQYFFEQTFGDLPEEMQAAREQGKIGMLLFFEAEDCPYCQFMLRKIFSQQHVQDWYRERFVNIAVDIHGDVELKDFDGITLPSKVFSDHRKIFLTPVVSFLDLDGVEIYRHLGMTKTPEDFLLIGEYIEGEHYFDTEFKVFAKARGLKNGDDILITPAADTE
ncbi:MAG: thioredoxin fold domain-containing protein [Gammaproteobacteria bacterium]|nr:thioredoxin fold domain-containing protein [Gammaproteobacteria bacterium]MDH3417290.1 thioredoxin fold domain-containing protein [Gammaproteobacteria bacterium]